MRRFVFCGSTSFPGLFRLTRQLCRAPLQNYAIIAIFMVATMGLSNTSLTYLNYPTQVLFKSCKLIPVMIGGIILLKKRYVLLEYASALLLCAGLVEITLGNAYGESWPLLRLSFGEKSLTVRSVVSPQVL